MTIGVAIEIKPGLKDPRNVYIRLRNRAVYRYGKPVDEAQRTRLMQKIAELGNRVPLRNWVRVR